MDVPSSVADNGRITRFTAEVETAFLNDVASWREALACGFALGNPTLRPRELTVAAQRTIDGLTFLRIGEARGSEPRGQLQAICQGNDCYGRLCELFRRTGKRFNTGLFCIDPGSDQAEPSSALTTELALADKPLQQVIDRLHCTASPYAFPSLPADILGRIYEHFVGLSICPTTGRGAFAAGTPRSRKAGGVYYTPTGIVDYVVRHTVGQPVQGQTPRQVAKLRVIDPACGAGSFLLGAFQFLIDWHRDWYVAHGASKHAKQVYESAAGRWHLTATEKKRILVNNIYGVDIDRQAIEVTRLSLLLKAIENDDRETPDRAPRPLPDGDCPDLRQNIKCGNSLVGSDYYTSARKGPPTEKERNRINAFDWPTEFPTILGGRRGGFDAVIGNPPWGQKEIAVDDRMKKYIQRKYPSTQGIYDLFRPFVEQSIRLARPEGLVGLVLPDVLLLKDYPTTRKLLLDQLTLDAIDWWGMAFDAVVIDAATVVGRRRGAPENHRVRVELHDPKAPLRQKIRQKCFLSNPRYAFNLRMTPATRAVLVRLAKFPRLGDLCEIHEGVHSGNIRRELFVDERLDDSCEQLIFGRDEILPYLLRWDGKYARLSALPKHRTAKRYANPGRPEWYRRNKLLVRRTGDRVLSAVDRQHRYASNNFFLVFPRNSRLLCLDGLCAVLNSRLMTWYFRAIEPRQGRAFAELKIKHLESFPLPKELRENGDDHLRTLCRRRARSARALVPSISPRAAAALKQQQTRLDEEIDRRVFSLFRLAAEDLEQTPLPRSASASAVVRGLRALPR